MRKTILTYGLIGGGLSMIFTCLIATLCEREILTFGNAEGVGYASMVIALSMIFFGIKSYRDNYGKGAITFWKGVQIGILITCIGSVGYVIGGELYTAINPGFAPKVMEKYKEFETNKMKQKGASQEEIDTVVKQMTDMVKMMENPLIRFVIYLVEIFPVGVVITVLSAALLRKRELLPAATTA
jgi:Protein of unknown function (DUF4199)